SSRTPVLRPSATLFRSDPGGQAAALRISARGKNRGGGGVESGTHNLREVPDAQPLDDLEMGRADGGGHRGELTGQDGESTVLTRSEEHTSELQSPDHRV